jgi:hypothetical protein
MTRPFMTRPLAQALAWCFRVAADGSDARRGSYKTFELEAHGFSRNARGAQSELAAIVSHTT